MKKFLVAVLAFAASSAFAASLVVGAGSLSGSASGSAGGSLAATASNSGPNAGLAASHNDTRNTGAVLTGSTTFVTIAPVPAIATVGGTVSTNQTVTNSAAAHAQTGGSGLAAAGGLGAGLTGGASFSGFVLTLP